jgi:hypothetical protein
LEFDAAMKRTIGPKDKPFRNLFQILAIFVCLMATNSSNFLVLGLPFMKVEPKSYTCKDISSGVWRPCDKSYICSNSLTRDQYYAGESDIDNWQN